MQSDTNERMKACTNRIDQEKKKRSKRTHHASIKQKSKGFPSIFLSVVSLAPQCERIKRRYIS